METSKNIEKSDKKKTSHMSQILSGFSDRIKDAFNKTPKIEAFWNVKWRLDKCESLDRVQKIKEDENEYLKISIKPWDKKDFWRWTERAEIQQKEKINYDEEYVQNFTFQIPKDFVLCPRRTVIWQWKRSPEITNNDAPLLSHRIKKIYDEDSKEYKYYLVLTDWKVLENGTRREIGNAIPMDDIIWKDIKIENKIRFSDNWESKIIVKMWEEIIYDWTIGIPHSKKNKDGKTQAYFKFGLYRDRYKYTIKKIKKDKILEKEEKKVQIEEMKKAENKEREKDSYIILKDYEIEESGK